MRAKLLCAAVVIAVSSGLLVFCVGDDQNTNKSASTNDAQGTDAPPAQGFTINLAPSHVTADPGDSSIAITINVVRAQGFTDDVSFTITPPAHVTATNAVDTGNGGTSSSFSITVDGTAPLGDITLTVTAANPTKTFVQNANLGIHIGTLVDVGDGGITVPSWATSLEVKAWGAGGGAACPSCAVGGTGGGEYGGGGGFASDTVTVTPNTTLVAMIGTGGASGFSAQLVDAGCPTGFTGGSGGGFTGLQVKGGNFLVIAGGGGGSGLYGEGIAGAGGGANGETATSDAGCAGSGGTQDGGGTVTGTCANPGANGKSLQGGNAYSACSATLAQGGQPGGGNGGVTYLGSGGGGGGFFGGAGGGTTGVSPNGGGGGGSGFVASDAGTLTTGTGVFGAKSSDPDFLNHCPTGAATGGVPSTNGGVGGNGCIVIRYTKP